MYMAICVVSFDLGNIIYNTLNNIYHHNLLLLLYSYVTF